MKRKIFLGIFVLALSVNPAFSADLDTLNGTPYLTKNSHFVFDPLTHVEDDGPIDLFQWDEKPEYRFDYKLSGISDFNSHEFLINTTWTFLGNGTELSSQGSGSCTGCSGDIFSYGWWNFPNWSVNRQPGDWTANLDWNIDGGATEFNQTFGFQITGPTVTPEPTSMLLFGLGAGALALARRRKKL